MSRRRPGARAALRELERAAAGCRNCDLWRNATQTVFGEGRPAAPMMLVGEQPGDQEDLAGRPFVGPAGRLLDGALADAGIDRDEVYLTNAVKHFKWKARGKRRIHDKPSWGEGRRVPAVAGRRARGGAARGAGAARGDGGAGAARALVPVTQSRGVPLEDTGFAPHVLATVHPSSILRERDDESRHAARELFVADLRAAAALL